MNCIHSEVPRFWRIIRLKPFRNTTGVSFDIFPMALLPRIDGIDRVIHQSSAFSPGSVGEVRRPWYVHPHQEDNLMVLHGKRRVDIYTLEHRRLENFVVTADHVEHNGKVLFEAGLALQRVPQDRLGRGRLGLAKFRSPPSRIRHRYELLGLRPRYGDGILQDDPGGEAGPVSRLKACQARDRSRRTTRTRTSAAAAG
jgi:hypothetical protein